MRGSEKTAASNRVADKPHKRLWFIPDQGRLSYSAICKKRGWTPIEDFASWNDNDGGLALAMDRKGRVFLIGGEPHIQPLTLADSVEFYASMDYESQEGGDLEARADWFNAIAVALRKGGAK